MSRTVLLTLGRLPKGLDIARALHGAGCRVIVAEPYAWHLARVSSAVARSVQVTAPNVDREAYLAELAALVRDEGVELVVPVSEEIFHTSFLRERLPAGVRLNAMPSDVLLGLHDKHAFIARCREFGLDAPDTWALGTPEAAALAREAPTVVKPVYSCSGRGVQFLAEGAELPVAAPGEPAIVQRFVAGEVRSTCSIAHEGRVLTTVVYRGAVMSGTVAVCFELVERHPAIERWVETFAARTGFSGFISFDFVVDAEGRPYGIECNPRATSGLHFIDPGDLAATLLDPTHGRPIRRRPQRLLQQFYPCLTETQKSMFADRARFGSNLRHLWRARDVTWSWRDPLPFVTMPATSMTIIAAAIRQGVTFGEVATLDVGWYRARG